MYWIACAAVGIVTIDFRKQPPLAYLLIAACVTGAVFPIVKDARRHVRAAGNRCISCGYDLRATPNRCPECGDVTARTEPA